MKAPAFFLEFCRDGRTWGITQKVKRFEFIDSEEELDQLKLVVEDSRLILLDHPDLLDDGKTEIRFKFGYADMLSPMKRVIVTQVLPTFSDTGEITLSIIGHDKGVNLTGGVETKVWENGKEGFYLSDIAIEIAKRYGLTPVVEPTKWKYYRKAQGNLSDIEFLQKLAKEAVAKDSNKKGVYKVYIQDNELHFHPVELENKPIKEYTFYTDRRGELKRFAPKSNTQLQKGAGTEVNARGIDEDTGKEVNEKSNNENTDRTVLGNETILVDAVTGETRTGKIRNSREQDTPFDTEESKKEKIKDKADNEFKEAEMKALEATALVIGHPWLQAKKLVMINNVGKRYSGLWYIKEVKHTISDSGYICELSLVKNAVRSMGTGTESKGNENKNKEAEDNKKTVEIIKIDARTGERIE